MLEVVGQRGPWENLKSSLLKATGDVCAGLPIDNGGKKRPGGGMRLSTLHGKHGRKVAARRNIRKQSTSPNMLSIWQNPRLNKKSWRTLYPTALTFSVSPAKWDAKTWMSRWETCPQWCWRVMLGWQNQDSCLKGTLWAPLECGNRLGPGLPHGSLSHGRPGPHIPLDLVIKAIKLMNVARLLAHPWL